MNRPVAVVTGGAQGIGKAMTRRFLMEGYGVVMADIDSEASVETLAEYSSLGLLRFVSCDVSQETDVMRLTRETLTAFGGVNALINNAAIGRNGPVTELSLADWNRVIGINLTGPFLCAKHLAPSLRERKGAIINIASTRAFMSEPGTEAYSASKGGIIALTHALAASLAPDIRVNSISPGWIETAVWQKKSRARQPLHSDADLSQHWAGRVGEPDDIANMAVYLASSKSGFMTGTNIMVDGGMTRKMIYV